MKRELKVNMYKNLKIDVYFEDMTRIQQLPHLCYTKSETNLDINEVIFLVDEAHTMDMYVNGIHKWYWAKELVMNQIIRYLGDNITYSYITSDLSVDLKLMDKYSSQDAIDWINLKQRSGLWEPIQGMQQAHKTTIFNRDALLIIITDGNKCINPFWKPLNNIYKHYYFINFDANDACLENYDLMLEQFNQDSTLSDSCSFNFKYVINENQTLNFIKEMFNIVSNRVYQQISPGFENTTYQFKSYRWPEPIMVQTDQTGMFTFEQLELLPNNYDVQIGRNNSFYTVRECSEYTEPELPIPNPEDPNDIPSEIEIIEPINNLYIHFSDAMIGGQEIYGQVAKINNPQFYCHLLGQGNYIDSFVNLINCVTLDGVAISPGVRIVVYSKPNFGGMILADLVGPMILNDNIFNNEIYAVYHHEDYPIELQNIFPQEVRYWIRDLRSWKNGSFKIIFP